MLNMAPKKDFKNALITPPDTSKYKSNSQQSFTDQSTNQAEEAIFKRGGPSTLNVEKANPKQQSNPPKPRYTKAEKGKSPMVDSQQPHVSIPIEMKKTKKDLMEYISKLSKVRKEAEDQHELSLIGKALGMTLDITKIRNRLRSEWRFVVGSVQFVDKGYQWFEVRFTNAIDLQRVWDERPYHVLGQLIVLRRWTSDFDSATTVLTHADLWLRIPQLPQEFICREAIQTIFTYNKIGEFIRFDRNSEQRTRVQFTRVCVEVQISAMRGYAKIPIGEKKKLQKFCIWYEDFPKGCGYCGAMNHIFDQCPQKRTIPKATKVIIRDLPGNENINPRDEWQEVRGKQPRNSSTNQHTSNLKPYMYGVTGVEVEFMDDTISPTSTDFSSSKSQASEFGMNFSLSDQHPTNLISLQGKEVSLQTNVVQSVGASQHNNDANKMFDANNPSMPLYTEEEDDHLNISNILEEGDDDDIYFEEEGDEQGELDVFMQEVLLDDATNISESKLSSRIEGVAKMGMISEASYKSVPSMHTNDSVLHLVDELGINQETLVKSESSKRKGDDKPDNDDVSSSHKKTKKNHG